MYKYHLTVDLKKAVRQNVILLQQILYPTIISTPQCHAMSYAHFQLCQIWYKSLPIKYAWLKTCGTTNLDFFYFTGLLFLKVGTSCDRESFPCYDIISRSSADECGFSINFDDIHLQVVGFTDVFMKHTCAKTVLIIVPINTLQNWINEFDMWLPSKANIQVTSHARFWILTQA